MSHRVYPHKEQLLAVNTVLSMCLVIVAFACFARFANRVFDLRVTARAGQAAALTKYRHEVER